MQRWMANAAGGTSQRLKPGLAIMRSLDRNEGWSALMPPATVLVLIRYPPIIRMVRQPFKIVIRPGITDILGETALHQLAAYGTVESNSEVDDEIA